MELGRQLEMRELEKINYGAGPIREKLKQMVVALLVSLAKYKVAHHFFLRKCHVEMSFGINKQLLSIIAGRKIIE